MRRHIDGARTQFKDDLQQIPAVQPQDRPAVRMDISDLLQSGRDLLRILQPRQEDKAVDLAGFPVFLIDRADLPGHYKPRDLLTRHRIFFNPVSVFQHIEPVFRRLQLLFQFLPPRRMGKITGSHDVDPLAPCPQIQMFRRTVFARRPGIPGMNM